MITNFYRLLLTLSVVAGTVRAMDQSSNNSTQAPAAMDTQAVAKEQFDDNLPVLIRPIIVPARNPKLQQQIQALKETGRIKNGKTVYAPGKFSCDQCDDYVGDSSKGLNSHVRSKHAPTNSAAESLIQISQSPSPNAQFSPRSSSPELMDTTAAQILANAASNAKSVTQNAPTIDLSQDEDQDTGNAHSDQQSSSSNSNGSNNSQPQKKRKLTLASATEDTLVLRNETDQNSSGPKRQRLESPQMLQQAENPIPTAAELIKAIAANSVSQVELLLASKADANGGHWGIKDDCTIYETVLGTAAHVGNPAIVKKLLEAKAIPNIITPSPLVNAVRQGSLDSVFMLLNAGAQTNACTAHGETAASAAAQGNPMLKDAMIALMQAHQKKNSSNNSNNAMQQ